MPPDHSREWPVAVGNHQVSGDGTTIAVILQVNQHGLAAHFHAQLGKIKRRMARIVEMQQPVHQRAADWFVPRCEREKGTVTTETTGFSSGSRHL